MAKREYTAAQMIDALEKSGGIQTAAAKALGCHRNTVGRYIREMPTVKAAADAAMFKNLDIAEAQLLRFIRGKAKGQKPHEQLDAIKFYLRTKGRQRGYGDRLDVLIRQGMEREMETVFDALQKLLPADLYLAVINELSGYHSTTSGNPAA